MKKKISLQNQPFAKKKKRNEDSELNVPIVTSIEEVVGTNVQHLTFDYIAEEKCILGVVVCQKLNSDTELVIRYNCEDRSHSFNSSDFQNPIIKLLPFTHADFISKRIRQKFTNDKENDI